MLTHRLATIADLAALRAVMARSIAELQKGFLTDAQIEASGAVMELDTQLIADKTYFIVADGGQLAGCGGWSRRATLYGGDHSASLRNPMLLNPAVDAARIRAMYTHPAHTRKGVGRLVMQLCEAAAREAGFASTELMATLSGEPLYSACGYTPKEHIAAPGANGIAVPLIRMGKYLTAT